MKKRLLLILVLFISLHFQAQNCGTLMEPISIQNRTNEATLIVEGEVINSESYWDIGHENIYTIHEVAVYKNAKGANVTTVFIETEGGQVENNIQETSSAARLGQGYEGVFFLKNSNHSFNIPQTTYKMVAAAQGYIKYDRINNKASDVFNVYTSIENELYSKIEQATHKTLTVIQEKQFISNTNAAFAIPVITSFSPTTASAGTDTTIVISGSSFGSSLGQVLFPNANDGGTTYTAAKNTQIVIWSDQTIIIKVPSTAGTGPIQVLNASGTTTSTGILTVPFSHSSASTAVRDYPRTIQCVGGVFTFDYYTDFNTSAAKPYFEEAFEVWNCESGINLAFGTTTTVDASVQDGINVVRFDNGSELPSGVLGQVVSRAAFCNNSNDATVLVEEMDITWNDDFSFYYGDGTPSTTQYDFKTIALHELGHAHQLNHIINSNNIMHYSLDPGVSKYSLSSDDVDGALHTMSVFTDSPDCNATMIENNACPNVAEVTLDPVNVDQCVTTDAVFTITATNAVTYQWQENNGSNWSNITDDATYGGATTATLTITNITFALSSNHYRCVVANAFGEEVNSGYAQLIVDEYPIGSAAVTAEACGGDIGVITFSFSNNSIRTDIEFSIDDGVTYPHTFSDNIGSGTAIDLAAGNYDVWVRWGNDECPLDLGQVTIQSITSPSTTVVAVDAAVGANDGKLQLAFIDDASQTTIEFSIDNGVTYPYTYDDTIGNAEINNLAGGDYEVWTRWDDTSCPTDLGTFTISEIAYTAIPGVNFESALDVLGYDNIAGDGRVPTANINTITSLDVSNQSISNLTGIEDFVALTDLRATNNSFDYIDVSNLSLLERLWLNAGTLIELDVTTNLLLEDLRVESNQLDEIDLTNNPLLQILQINNNLLEELNVTNNPDLFRIRTQDNPIKELDFSNNILLTQLQVNTSELTVLDIQNGNNANMTVFSATGNSNLFCINVDNAVDFTALWVNSIDATASFGENCNELTYVPDDNFENYLETHDASGTVVSVGDITSMGNGIPNDNFVTTTAINTVTNLDVESKSIIDLRGIEGFIALTDLNCSNNQITSLDVSQNTGLTDFNCIGNQITILDVTQNIVLTDFNCSRNQIAILDVTQNTVLTDLNCSNNQIAILDVSQNIVLADFKCFSNQIAILDVTQNTVLTDLVCSSNQIKVLDVTQNIQLTNLGCSDNLLDDLDVTQNTLLVTLKASGNNLESIDVTQCSLLVDFSCYTNAITSLDVTQNPLLVNLDCIENQLTNLDVTSNPNLEVLYASYNSIISIDVTQNPLLDQLYLEFNQITHLDISQNPALLEFYAHDNDLQVLNAANGNNALMQGSLEINNNPNLICVLVDDASDTTVLNSWDKDNQTMYNDVSCNVQISPKVFLQGAALNPNTGEENLMRDDLRVAGYIDTTSPYDPNSMDASVLAITGDNAIVDWVFIELRDANDNTLVITDTSALLQRDGDVVSLDGISPVTILIPGGDYYISIKHRNHLNIMTSTAFALSSTTTTIDFTDANNQITFGTNAQTSFGMPSGVVAMWAGDANGDGQLNYLGAASDIPLIRSQVFNDPDNSIFGGPPVVTYGSTGYYTTDVNMDGFTYYSGVASDVLNVRDNIFNNPSNSIFGGPPLATYIFIEQLP